MFGQKRDKEPNASDETRCHIATQDNLFPWLVDLAGETWVCLSACVCVYVFILVRALLCGKQRVIITSLNQWRAPGENPAALSLTPPLCLPWPPLPPLWFHARRSSNYSVCVCGVCVHLYIFVLFCGLFKAGRDEFGWIDSWFQSLLFCVNTWLSPQLTFFDVSFICWFQVAERWGLVIDDGGSIREFPWLWPPRTVQCCSGFNNTSRHWYTWLGTAGHSTQ